MQVGPNNWSGDFEDGKKSLATAKNQTMTISGI
jgi:hypothetical protein